MFTWEGGVVPTGRIRRESGSWGFIAILKRSGNNAGEELLVNECGSIPPEEDAMDGEQVGSTGMSCGTTINMKNYESVRVDCWCTLPCTESTVDEQYQKCYSFVTKKVGEYSAIKVAERG